MCSIRRICIVLICVLWASPYPVQSAGPDGRDALAGPSLTANGDEDSTGTAVTSTGDAGPEELTASAVICPFRSADVGIHLAGIIKAVRFEEGDSLNEGDVVVELFSERHSSAVARHDSRVQALQLVLVQAEQALKDKLVDLPSDSASRLEFARLRKDAESKRQKVIEAEEDLRLARLDLEACTVRSPFPGRLKVRYKGPHENVDRFERLFRVVDSSKVFAVSRIPDALASGLRRGASAWFVHSSGKRFAGVVDRLAVSFEGRSRTTRVYILLDNSGGDLEIGSAGSIASIR